MELYRKYRPEIWEEVIGQDQAVSILRSRIESKTLPHVVLLVGNSGTGKTTLAQIAARELGYTEGNLVEMDMADERGIDTIRSIKEDLRFRPLGAGNRIWIMDEVVQLPKVSQQAALGMLETCPEWAWFFLCTSSTEGLLPAFYGRCFVINLDQLSNSHLEDIITSVADRSGKGNQKHLSPEAVKAIIHSCGGSARRAIQLLEIALSVSLQQQIRAVLSGVADDEEIKFLATLLMSRRPWKQIAKAVAKYEHADLETFRRQILNYACAVLANRPDPMADAIIQAFRYSWADCGKAGLWSAAYECWYKSRTATV